MYTDLIRLVTDSLEEVAAQIEKHLRHMEIKKNWPVLEEVDIERERWNIRSAYNSVYFLGYRILDDEFVHFYFHKPFTPEIIEIDVSRQSIINRNFIYDFETYDEIDKFIMKNICLDCDCAG